MRTAHRDAELVVFLLAHRVALWATVSLPHLSIWGANNISGGRKEGTDDMFANEFGVQKRHWPGCERRSKSAARGG